MTGRQRRKASSSKGRGTAPSEIAPGVFLGNWDDALTFAGSRFCVLDEAPAEMPASTHVRIYDEEHDRADVESLDRIVSAMETARAKGRPVLVYCGHGVYRSPLAAAWFLKRTQGLTLDEAYERIAAVRPKAKPASKWLGNVSDLERA